jgi:hypothetical protein
VSRLYRRLRRRVLLLPLRVRLALAGTLLLPFALAIVFGLVFLRFEASVNASIDGDLRARADALATMVTRQGAGALTSTAAVAYSAPKGRSPRSSTTGAESARPRTPCKASGCSQGPRRAPRRLTGCTATTTASRTSQSAPGLSRCHSAGAGGASSSVAH